MYQVDITYSFRSIYLFRYIFISHNTFLAAERDICLYISSIHQISLQICLSIQICISLDTFLAADRDICLYISSIHQTSLQICLSIQICISLDAFLAAERDICYMYLLNIIYLHKSTYLSGHIYISRYLSLLQGGYDEQAP